MAGGVAILALYGSIKSVLLAMSLTRPLVFWDEWVFFGWYLAYLDGRLSFANYFDLWGDHRLFTTRLVLLLDATYFDLKSQMPIVVLYVVLLLIAVLIARLAFEGERGPARIVGFAAALGMTWSIAQWENLSFAFQVPHPFVHFFALLAYLALARALTDGGRHRMLWLAAACVADFLGIYSLGPGMLIVIPAIAMAIWLRRLDRFFWAFVTFHAAVLAVYFSDYFPPQYGRAPAGSGFAYIEFFGNFLGSPFRSWWDSQLLIGLLGAVVFLAAAGVLSYVALSRKIPVDRAAAVLLALAAFVLLEALAATYGRVNYGVAPRYATASIIFVASLLAFFWRITRGRRLVGSLMRAGLMPLTAMVILGTNSAYYEAEWRQHIATRDKAGFAFVNGVFPEEQTEAIGPSMYLPSMKKIATMGLAQFSASAHDYQAPLNSIVDLEYDRLPACRHGIESVTSSGLEWSEVKGWAIHPTEPRGIDWILAFNENGRLVGYTKPLVFRADIAAAQSLMNSYVGFDLYLNGAAMGPHRPAVIQLVATLSTGGNAKQPRACAMPVTVSETTKQ
jgi:hypothetical protein